MVRLRPIEGSELQLAGSEPVDLLQQNQRVAKSSHSAAAQALKNLQCKPLAKKPNSKDIETDEENLKCDVHLYEASTFCALTKVPVFVSLTATSGLPLSTI